MNQKKFGFFTALSMLIGICIGSGIFFKTANILSSTNGSVSLGVLVFVLAAICIVFGGLAMAELALRSKKEGGLVGYFEEFVSFKWASAYGLFFMSLYLPTITVILCWVSSIYTMVLFDIQVPKQYELFVQVIIGVVYMIVFVYLNTLSTRLGGRIQSLTTIIKLIPLFLIALTGLIFGKEQQTTLQSLSQLDMGMSGWLYAIVPMSFAYDGWTVSTTMVHDVANPQKTFRKVLIMGPLLILSIYVLYFLGVTSFLGVDTVLKEGKNAVFLVSDMLLGNIGGKVLSIIVLISVLGTTNGLVMAMIRMPQILASKGMLGRYSKQVDSTESGVSKQSSIIAVCILSVWFVIHYVVMQYMLLGESDISEIAIVFNYILYTLLYTQVYKFTSIKNPIFRYVVPTVAMLGSGVILFGSLTTNAVNIVLFFGVCAIPCALGYHLGKKALTQHQDSMTNGTGN
ncbi:APC family permease [Carnobacteriaceae bacterium zg-C25]|nr:APC family permease [Carnobacteriaceae bacterium zg-C25]